MAISCRWWHRWGAVIASAVCVAANAVVSGAQPAPRASAATAESRRGPADVQWVHETWTTGNGLPVNAINWVLQGRDGYLWAATFDGLVRFDGVRFTVFNTANTNGLTSNRIMSLREFRDGALWFTTEQGQVGRFVRGRVVMLDSARGVSASTGVLVSDDGRARVWVGAGNGLGLLNGDRVQPDTTVLRGQAVRHLQGLAEGGVLVVTRREAGRDVLWHRAANGAVTPLTLTGASDTTAITGLYEDGRGVRWVFASDGVWFGTSGARTLQRVPFGRGVISDALNVVDAPEGRGVYVYGRTGLYRVTTDSVTVADARSEYNPQRRLWVADSSLWHVYGNTVLRDGRPVFTLRDATAPARDPQHRIVSALMDREGSIWLGTVAAGLHRLKPALLRTYSVAHGLRAPNVYPVLVDRTGRVWVGAWGGGLTVLDPATGAMRVPETPFGGDIQTSFLEDGDEMLVAGYDGLWRCDREVRRCGRDATTVIGPQTKIFALHRDQNGVWLGSERGLFRREGNTWRQLLTADGAPAAPVRAFVTTRDGAVWMGTNGAGLARFQYGRFTRITRNEGLPIDLVRSLHEDRDGMLWVGTEGRGLVRLDPRAWANRTGTSPADVPSIVNIGTRQGLFDDVIHQILEDDFGRLWMNTNRGLFWVTRAGLNAVADGTASRVYATAYSERDGMLNREGNGGVQPAGAKARDGRLWFPTQDGLVVVDPARVRSDREPPPTVVERVLSGDSAFAPEPTGAGDVVTLPPNRRDVQVDFTALTFLEPANVRFRYRLDGYDQDWVDAGNRRTAFYTKLPPGRFTFRVQATNADGQWPASSSTLQLAVPPRWFETTVFRLLVLGALAALGVVLSRRRVLGLRSRTVELERVVAERTRELLEREQELARQNKLLEGQTEKLQALDSAKTRFFANVSHELRTPLTLTIGPLEDLQSRGARDVQEARWLDIALRNARRLLRLVNQILDVAKLEAGEMQLQPRPLDLAGFVRGIVGAFGSVADRKRISLTLDSPAVLRGEFDADAVEKILTNLLSNAVKFTPEGGHVKVLLALGSSASSARTVTLRVTDSGPGIPTAQLALVFERFYQVDETNTSTQAGTGIGLALVKELVELHGGAIDVASDARGTMFTVQLPHVPVEAAPAPKPVEGPITGQVRLFPVLPDEQAQDADLESSGRRSDVPTMLVVDDSEDLRAYIRGHFEGTYRVIEAGDGAAGVEQARQSLPDIVVADVMMPGTDGLTLVRQLRASPETEFLSIILLTAQAEDEQKLTGLASGADEYLVKPFDMRELDLRVRNLTAARRRLRDRYRQRGGYSSGEVIVRPVTQPVPSGEVEPVVPVAPPQLSAVDQQFMEKVQGVIAEQLGNPEFGVAELADAVAQDRSHLFRRVKQVFGTSPSLLLRQSRLGAAERLLVEEQDTVADVAYAVGFNSVSYFCQCFQQQYGETPAAYRGRAARGNAAAR